MSAASARPGRRRLLQAGAALGLSWLVPALAANAGPESRAPRFAAAWNDETTHRIGVLAQQGDQLLPVTSLEVPTRAHGLARQADGALLAASRRPGDWLLRWRPGEAKAEWVWAEPGRSFNGHVILSADGGRIFTSETDTDSGAGLVGVRDARSLEKLDEWPTAGIDPHALLLDDNGLIVANGGVPTQPETGRSKRNLDRMDSSVVRLDAADGRLLGQWRLQDQRLSLRHLARNGGLIGIALQAEHDDETVRAAAPLLALFDGGALRLIPDMPPLAGYGGDIVACGSGFAMGAPRADCIAIWQPATGWRQHPLEEGCAVASIDGRTWGGGRAATDVQAGAHRLRLPADLRLDNHWLAMA